MDPRLESAGASYQDLINAAHAKGIKIFQDVVYNHSSRWGAKGLFTPTVYGTRDDQWKWYYDQPQAGRGTTRRSRRPGTTRRSPRRRTPRPRAGRTTATCGRPPRPPATSA
ncbi:alpha-amylase family glycosyl hydrolase [Micromonospora sp. BRA006-A]|nr:alpha-amylase family glycosyl hydrolase [Micromonospora sp. BRA006-A]